MKNRMGVKYRKERALWTNDEFSQMTLPFKVGAILSDGQWYTDDKIRLYAKEKTVDGVDAILDTMLKDGRIIRSDNGVSYRMSLDQLRQWRRENGISIDAQIIPKLLYPRIFGEGSHQMTEVEMFLSVPLHPVGILTFRLYDDSRIDDLRSDLGYLGLFKPTKEEGKYKLFALSNKSNKAELLKYEDSHGGHIFVPGKFNSNNTSKRRETIEFDQTALSEFVSFYVEFSKVLVPSMVKTFDVYLGSGPGDTGMRRSKDTIAEGNSVILQWILELVQTYNESRCVPFSAAAMATLPKKGYDFASSVLGDEVNKFQLEKNRSIKRLNEVRKKNGTLSSKYIDDDVIVEDMNESGYAITGRKYRELDNVLKTWQKSHSNQQLDWEETGEEKKFKNSASQSSNVVSDAFSNSEVMEDLERRSDVQSAVVNASTDSGDWKSGVTMLRLLADSSLANVIMGSNDDIVTDNYKDSLAVSLSNSGLLS